MFSWVLQWGIDVDKKTSWAGDSLLADTAVSNCKVGCLALHRAAKHVQDDYASCIETHGTACQCRTWLHGSCDAPPDMPGQCAAAYCSQDGAYA